MSIERIALALVHGWGHRDRAAQWAERRWGLADPAYRALSASDMEAGGVVLGVETHNTFVNALRDRSVVRRLGARSVRMPTGEQKTPKVTSGAQFSYVGENENAPASEVTLGSLTMSMKKLVALVPVSASLTRYSPAMAEPLVREELLQGASAVEDVRFLRGQGVEFGPRGMRYRAPAGNVIAANGTVNLANVVDDLEAAMAAVEDEKVPMLRPGWAMAPRTRRFLATLRDGNGWAFKDELVDGGTLFGWPVGVTTGIPTNLGGGGDESEVYFADFSQLAIGDALFTVDVAKGAAYFEEGALRAGFSEDVWAIRVLLEHDFTALHDEAIAVLTDVTWGA